MSTYNICFNEKLEKYLMVFLLSLSYNDIYIATDKRGYPHNTFFVSPRKHMLWVLIRSASARRF